LDEKLILSADETVVCPKCAHKFPLRSGIAEQTVERYERDFQEALEAGGKRMREVISREEVEKARSGFEEQIRRLQREVTAAAEDRKELEEKVRLAQTSAREKALAEYTQEKDALLKEVAEKDLKLADFREQELALRKQAKDLDERQANLELEMTRKLDEEKRRIEEAVRGTESEKYRLVEAELRKKIEDAQKANEELSRKLEQGSQQLQGEVLELEVEDVLRQAFPFDTIEEVKKGQRGADVHQTVISNTGKICGKIVWEAKRAEGWSNDWVRKLKDDQKEQSAELAVLVTTAMPRGVTEPISSYEGIWLVKPLFVKPLAAALRFALEEKRRTEALDQNRSAMAEILYDYIFSPRFTQKLRSAVEAFQAMKTGLDAERTAMQRIWKKREAQLDTVLQNVLAMTGELEGFSQRALPGMEDVAMLGAGEQDSDGE
jgi:hypothetical protein